MTTQRTNPTDIVVHNRTTADIRQFHEAFKAAADGALLPEEIADIFTVEVTRKPDGKTWVHVDFA